MEKAILSLSSINQTQLTASKNFTNSTLAGLATILSPNSSSSLSISAATSLLNILTANTLDTTSQASLVGFLVNTSLPSQSSTSFLNILTQNNLSPSAASSLITLLTQPSLPVITQSYMINVLSENQLNTQTQTNLINVMVSSNLSMIGQSSLMSSLLAPNMDPSRQTSVINTVSSTNFTGAGLDQILNTFANIIMSIRNLAFISTFLKNSTNLTQIMAQLNVLSSSINNDFFSSNTTQILNILTNYTGDMTGCLVNCNNKGDCEYINGTLSCFCKQNYQGDACQAYYNPCSTGPCMNSGECVLKPMDSDPTILNFTCVCNSTLFEGPRCQYPIDYCKNETCNGQGACTSQSGQAVI